MPFHPKKNPLSPRRLFFCLVLHLSTHLHFSFFPLLLIHQLHNLLESLAVSDSQLFVETGLEQFLMVVRLEIVCLVSVAIKESCLSEMQFLLVICPTTCHLLNTLPICLWQIKENISPKSCFIMAPSRKIGYFF